MPLALALARARASSALLLCALCTPAEALALRARPARPRALMSASAPSADDGAPEAGAPGGNPFFAAYSEEELAFVWDVHQQWTAEDAPEAAAEDVGASEVLGLHDSILRTIEEIDDEARAEREADAEPG